MNTKEKSIPFYFILALILAVCFFVYGSIMVYKKLVYSETMGRFSHYSSYIDRDDDGNEHTKYEWFYEYKVNGSKYLTYSSGHSSYYPSTSEEIVKYNPSNPKEAILQSDHGGIILIGVGLFIGIIPITTLISYISERKYDYVITASSTRNCSTKNKFIQPKYTEM